jgi:glyoxylase-like metal-dependent hydrolase (beta-lactamase superfamily II)
MTSAVHHLDCAPMAPLGSFGGRMAPPRMAAHCLLVEGPDTLTLVDTGAAITDVAESRRRLGRGFVAMMRPALDAAQVAAGQVRALGYDPAEVTDVVVTHLDLDHAGGLADFPGARVHVFGDELDAALAPRTRNERQRYVAAQWGHGPIWMTHDVAGEDWYGFEAVSAVSEDVLMVPLRGHTRGHCAVAVRRPGGDWFLHAGDAYFHASEKDAAAGCPPGLKLFQDLVQVDGAARRRNQDRLRSLHPEHRPATGRTQSVTMFCAHDAGEFDALAGITD